MKSNGILTILTLRIINLLADWLVWLHAGKSLDRTARRTIRNNIVFSQKKVNFQSRCWEWVRLSDYCIILRVKMVRIPLDFSQRVLAEWLRRQTNDLTVTGSNPTIFCGEWVCSLFWEWRSLKRSGHSYGSQCEWRKPLVYIKRVTSYIIPANRSSLRGLSQKYQVPFARS